MQNANVALLSSAPFNTPIGKSVNDYLFCPQNLSDYQIGALQSLTLVNKAMVNARQPFSGVSPHRLAQQVNQINLATPAASFENVLSEVESIYLNNAVYFHHPDYVAHLNCPVAYPAVLAEQILSAVNTSVDTWDQSGGATLIEQKLINWTCEQLGFDSQADGIFTSGGTQSNLMGMLMAREQAVARYCPEHCVKHQGLPAIASKFRIFTSQLSHFSIQKAAALLGLGYESVIAVATDAQFKMDPTALSQAIDTAKLHGLIPICINATAGTTDYGSIDNLDQLAQIARQHAMWFHVDAAYGGGLLLSEQYRHRLSGIEHADSVTLDYHKSFMQPVSSSAFLCRNRQHFSHITLHSDYLNPLCEKDQGYPNLVDKSLQTTRRFDALKLWMTLRMMGPALLGEGIDNILALARQCYDLLYTHPDFEVLNDPELSAIVFRFAPAGLTNTTPDELNPAIRDAFLQSGEAMIARTQVAGAHYLKFTLLNPATTITDLQRVVQRISELGWALMRENQ
ncbi:pyridoxal phosphate-dependent decarboxylase family protein [Salinimonas sediminis]|uniref:Aminotransferase class I/II-fold pyridoxal phosphate-dependent enzyme n=1 Tax=Salinimonas sediminis TaxID=2303538 RepID=A0A346NQS6_9ALTE|nr:aspartate aminotransferase family protein [Salinimonas sediminis]AXR07883.1 aminotransferase class I/II-fold pyridoxal phosphate-dependent enzyme [Salinimonas sediminis]